jgi:hypothetical protein
MAHRSGRHGFYGFGFYVFGFMFLVFIVCLSFDSLSCSPADAHRLLLYE